MTRRKILKKLKLNYDCSKKVNSSSDLIMNLNNNKYHVLIIKVSTNTLVTINSKHMWKLKRGKINGIRFKTVDSILLNLKGFMELTNKIIIVTNKPYKVLKAINESEVEDVSEKSSVYDFKLIHDLTKINDILKA